MIINKQTIGSVIDKKKINAHVEIIYSQLMY